MNVVLCSIYLCFLVILAILSLLRPGPCKKQLREVRVCFGSWLETVQVPSWWGGHGGKSCLGCGNKSVRLLTSEWIRMHRADRKQARL